MDKTLRTRGITAIVFAAVVFTLIFLSPLSQLLLFLIIGVGAGYELLKMSKASNVQKILLLSLIVVLYGLVYLNYIDASLLQMTTVVIVVIYSLLALDLLKGKAILINTLPYLIFIYPGFFALGLINEIQSSKEAVSTLLITTLLLIWANDSFAYLIGRKIGKRPLNKKISPKKTLEGFYAGGIFTILTAILLSFYFPSFSITGWMGLGVTVWLSSVIGDLVQSAFKRHYGIKDSGNILPGHGGFFDRFDSFIFTLPFVYLITTLLQN